MSSGPLDRILREHGEELLTNLAEKLSPADLQSLLMRVYELRATKQSPARLLEQHENNRFVRPSIVSPETLLEFDRVAYSVAKPTFEPIELAPLSPMGVTAALTTVSQNTIVSTSRNTEAISDPTNVMALECAVRRKQAAQHERIRFCCSERVTRGQPLSQPKSWAHFKLFALTSSGRDEGSYRFESDELVNHISFYLRLFGALSADGFSFGSIRVLLTNFVGEELRSSHEQVLDRLRADFPYVAFEADSERKTGRGYYIGSCMQIHVKDKSGEEFFLADGGVVDWTQQLLSNKKERLVISGIGTERLCSIFAPARKA